MPTPLELMEQNLLFGLIPGHGRLALDIGANTGFWSRALAERFNWVHAYEPQRGLTSGPGNVVVFNSAVGRVSGSAVLTRYADSGHATIVEREDVGYGNPVALDEVGLVALDDYYYMSDGVDFVKIDVEGAEVDVLLGARRVLEESQPTLVIEIHSSEARERVLELLPGHEVEIIPNPVAPEDPRYCWVYAH